MFGILKEVILFPKEDRVKLIRKKQGYRIVPCTQYPCEYCPFIKTFSDICRVVQFRLQNITCCEYVVSFIAIGFTSTFYLINESQLHTFFVYANHLLELRNLKGYLTVFWRLDVIGNLAVVKFF